MSFSLKIVTPKGIYLEKTVDMLNIRTTSGNIGVLANHLPLASPVEICEMNYVIGGKKTYYAISGGFIYVGKTETTIIANAIETPEEIDLNRAKAAKERAEKRLSKLGDDIDIARAEIALKRAMNRINVKETNY